MPFFKIAVTGSAGSGKSLACKYFSELGLKMFDCDKIAREVVEPGMQTYNDIISFFGKKIVQNDGALNRLKLRKIISNDEKMRRGLEAIIHPAIMNNLYSKIKKAETAGEDAIVVEIPLLFELNLIGKFDCIVTIASQENDLVERIIKRDNVSKNDAQNILSIQFSQKEKIRRSDFVIWNTSGVDELKSCVVRLYKKIKKECLT